MVCPCVRARRLFVDHLTTHEITLHLGGKGRGVGAVSPGADPPPAPARARQHPLEASPFAVATKHTGRFITMFCN